jgi:hypothetical protein
VSKRADNLRQAKVEKGFDFIIDFSRLMELPTAAVSIRSGKENSWPFMKGLKLKGVPVRDDMKIARR